MARNKRGDEALIRMLTEDARLAAGGTPKARANRRKSSRSALHREMLLEAVCGCGAPAVVSMRKPNGWNGGFSYKKFCERCAGLTTTIEPRPEPPRETVTKTKVRRSGVQVFA